MKCNVKDLMAFWQKNKAFRSKEWYETVVYSCIEQAFKNRLEGLVSEEYLNVYAKNNKSFHQERQAIYSHAMTTFVNVKNSSGQDKYLHLVKQYMEIERLEEELGEVSFWKFKQRKKLREQLELIMVIPFEDVMLTLQHHYTVLLRYQRDEFYNVCANQAIKWLDNE